MLFSGTIITNGICNAMVVRTGMNTEIGKIQQAVMEAKDEEEKTPLGQKIDEFGEWLEAEGLQAIATRVSTGSECSIIIEDGYVKSEEQPVSETTTTNKTWKAGTF